MIGLTAALLATTLFAPSGAVSKQAAISPRLRALGQTCQVRRGISAEAFERFLRKPARGHAGWMVVVAGESSELRGKQAAKIAEASGAELRRVALPDVLGKAIGETEKNLDALLGEAAEAGVVLFFDEADALFGKRTEVKDSHDRYANQEVSYLMQRLEAHADLVLLGTRKAEGIDRTGVPWIDAVATVRPDAPDGPLPWDRLCWPPRA